MLILVAVTVTVALQGGLFNKANDARNQTKAAVEREQLQDYLLGQMDLVNNTIPETLDDFIMDGEVYNIAVSGDTLSLSQNGEVKKSYSIKNDLKININISSGNSYYYYEEIDTEEIENSLIYLLEVEGSNDKTLILKAAECDEDGNWLWSDAMEMNYNYVTSNTNLQTLYGVTYPYEVTGKTKTLLPTDVISDVFEDANRYSILLISGDYYAQFGSQIIYLTPVSSIPERAGI